MPPRLALLVVIASGLAGCTGQTESPSDAKPAAVRSAAASPGGGICPLTIPNGSSPPGGNAAGMNHGNARLWTVLWPHNVVIVTPDAVGEDGAIGMKWPWWRGVEGDLVITGRRLDGRPRQLTADSSSSGYGRSGFLPSAVYFPTEGCWEVTGRVGNDSLTFVTLVVKASRYGLEESAR